MIEITSTSIRDIFPLTEGWEWRKIEDLIREQNIKGGRSPKKKGGIKTYPDGDIPCFTGGDVTGDKNLIHAEKGISEDAFKNASQFDVGTLFITRSGVNPGRVGIIQQRSSGNDQIIGVICKGTNLLVNYVYWWFSSNIVQRKLKEEIRSGHGRRSHLNQKNILNIDIPIPYPDNPSLSLEIQERLTQRVDALMTEMKEAKRLLEGMWQNTMQILDFALQENFSNSTTKNWEKKPIKAIAGPHRDPSDLEENTRYTSLPYVSGRNIENAMGRLIQNPPPAKPDLTGKRRYFQPDMVLYQTRDIQLRKVVHVDFEGLHSQDIYALQVFPGIELDPRFLMWSLMAPPFKAYAEVKARDENEYQENSKRRPNLASADLLAYKLPYPDKKSQISIVSRLNDVRESITEMQKILDTDKTVLEQLEQSTLEQAFQGKL